MNMARELMVMLSLAGVYTLWVLLPLIPSILIYRLFPSTSVAVSGPLSGLTVRAGGAFAAYLVVFVLSFWIVSTTKEMIGSFEHPFWTISGQVKLVDADGKDIMSEDLLRKIEVHLNPDFYNHDRYYFDFTVAEPVEGKFPYVRVEIPGWGVGSIDLRSLGSKVTKDYYKKTIEISEPIVVRQDRTASGQALRARPEGLPALGPAVGLRFGNNPPRPRMSE